MTLQITRLAETFVAEVRGLDLRRTLDEATFGAVLDAFHEHAVLVFRDQRIDDDQQIAFSRRFGALETSIRHDKPGGSGRPEISYLANVDENGELYDADDPRYVYHIGNQWWHTDSSFKPVPANASLLSGRIVPPEGGETEFADLRAAWEALPEGRRRQIDGLVAEHSIVYSRQRISGDIFSEEEKAALPPVRQAVVRTHPATGRKALYLGSHASHVIGWPVEEGRALLQELLDFATQPQFVYRHRWRQNDLVMWDNRSVLHRGRPWDSAKYPRVMIRTTVAGNGPTA
jgi:alpha-ketoglutarate-dependent 2,4-dichlorophenoxyacetate dioxygenase